MEKTEIKKVLYKEKPKAKFGFIRLGVAYYCAVLKDNSVVNFEIPISDMGDADFSRQMDAKLLCRWIVNNLKTK